MNRFGLDFHHLGLAVPEPNEAARWLTGMGYRIGPTVFDTIQLVQLAMCEHPQMPDVEIVSPSDKASPIDRLLRRNGPLFYHVCYVTPCIDTALAAIEREGFNVAVVSEPKPAILFGGRDVAFYSVDGFGLIELLQDRNSVSTVS
jgi:methylmalonyl-CoA/ethylmalonyl-CoA epimerase